ncbi:MAG: hypothetical protein IJB78_02970 [Oscillospiraceae bacterium]|nr:hypothetical protein [Oscillospiraceae bacterium]
MGRIKAWGGAVLTLLLLCGCGSEKAAAFSQTLEQAQETEIEALLRQASELTSMYFYDEALALLENCGIEDERIKAAIVDNRAHIATLTEYTGDVAHIFFHSLIVYPEMVFKDTETASGGYNAGFAEKQELEKILPQLYERGYVLYSLDEIWEMTSEGMQRKKIMLPVGKKPLVLSVDDVAYAYGDGFAQRLSLDEKGQLTYQVKNPQGETIYMPDGDVMGVVDAFVKEHPDFSYQGHKGTIALTGFQGAFGYDYEDTEQAEQIRLVSAALKEQGWSFACHSYTHNRVNNFYGPGCSEEKISYDVNKWLKQVVPCIGSTRLFIAPFGYRVQQPALQCILDAGFQVYCTVDNKVYNELNRDYALMSRIEIGGYSMTYYKETLDKLFFNVDEVFDKEGRPPVI